MRMQQIGAELETGGAVHGMQGEPVMLFRSSFVVKVNFLVLCNAEQCYTLHVTALAFSGKEHSKPT